jgi:predicted nucleic acid-binding protein
MTENKIVLDTDFIVSLAVKTDTTSSQAQHLYTKIVQKEFIILNLVKYETATVLSKKINHLDAIQTLKNID